MPSHISHAALPYPVRGARFTVDLPFFDTDGALVDAAGTSASTSVDGAAATTAAGTPPINVAGIGSYFTVDGRETNCSLLKVKITTSNSLPAYVAIHPRILPVLHGIAPANIASAGSATTLTLHSSASAIDNAYLGAILRTTGAPGGGGAAGTNNQARIVIGYVGTTKVATVSPAWEALPTTAPLLPDAGTTYEVLQTEMMSAGAAEILAIKAKTDSLTFTGFNVHSHVQAGTISGVLDTPALVAIGAQTETELNDRLLSADSSTRLERSTKAIAYGKTNNCADGVSIITLEMNPGAIAIDQFKNAIMIFDSSATNHSQLRGARAEIISNTAGTSGGNVCTLTVSPAFAIPPAANYTFTII